MSSSMVTRALWIVALVVATAGAILADAATDTPLNAEVDVRGQNGQLSRHWSELSNGGAIASSVAELNGLLRDLRSATSPDARLRAAEVVVGAVDELLEDLDFEILANDERYVRLLRELRASGSTLARDLGSADIANSAAFALADSLWEDHGSEVFDDRIEGAFKLRKRLDGLTERLRGQGYVVGPHRSQAQIHEALARTTLIDRSLQDVRELVVVVALQIVQFSRHQTAIGNRVSDSDGARRSRHSLRVSSTADRGRLGFAQASVLH